MEPRRWLEDREHALEEEYFWKKERTLLTRLRADSRREHELRVLRAELGTDDEVLLAKLQASGLTPDTLGLLFVVPLVEVAWADGDVSTVERQLILEMAARRGIASDTPASMSSGDGSTSARPISSSTRRSRPSA